MTLCSPMFKTPKMPADKPAENSYNNKEYGTSAQTEDYIYHN